MSASVDPGCVSGAVLIRPLLSRSSVEEVIIQRLVSLAKKRDGIAH